MQIDVITKHEPDLVIGFIYVLCFTVKSTYDPVFAVEHICAVNNIRV